jgi:AcrR family transcriptional regulator
MTPKERRTQKRKHEILEAALEVLSQDGYAAASMDKIAEKAMLTRVALYQQFGDKTKLMAALREYKLLELAQHIKTAIAEHVGFESRLLAAVRGTVAYQRQNQGFFHVLLASSFSSELAADMSLKPFLFVVSSIFEEGMAQGLVRPNDPFDYAGLTAAMVFLPSIKRAFVPVSPDYQPPEDVADFICQVLLSGVQLPQARGH